MWFANRPSKEVSLSDSLLFVLTSTIVGLLLTCISARVLHPTRIIYEAREICYVQPM